MNIMAKKISEINELGFIGVGDLAEYTITGLRRGGFEGNIMLSPRNREMSQKLAKEWQCEIKDSNQAVVDDCRYVVLSTRPSDCLDALAELKLSDQHVLISVVAGVDIDQLREVAGDIEIVRAMPVNCAKAGASPTLVYPQNIAVNTLFNYCGNSITADDEAAFAQGSILACVYTWYFELFQELINATSGEKLPRGMATQLVLGMARGAASLSLQSDQQSPGEIANAIATDGTFSRLGLDILQENAAYEPWQAACTELAKRMVK